jgi:hypothetical protein
VVPSLRKSLVPDAGAVLGRIKAATAALLDAAERRP